MNLPAFIYITAFNDYQTGFNILLNKFNGLSELAKRENVILELSKIYKDAGERGFIEKNNGISANYWHIKLNWIELIASQRPYLKDSQENEKKELMRICREKFDMKQRSEFHSFNGSITTLLLMARILESDNNNGFTEASNHDKNLNEFVKTSQIMDANIVSKIIELSDNYLNQ